MRRVDVDKLVQVAVAVALTFAIVATGIIARSSADATRETRQVLCIGIEHNTNNTAAIDPLVLDLCAQVGVYPASG